MNIDGHGALPENRAEGIQVSGGGDAGFVGAYTFYSA
jgi:hypothetical protein